MARRFNVIYVHPEVAGHPRTRRIVEMARPAGVLELPPGAVSLESIGAESRAKSSLALLPYRGSRVEACPCSKAMRCCRYRVLQLVEGCPYDCAYCILQGYLNRPVTLVYPELELAFEELERDMAVPRGHAPRYGTGELGDSLALEELTGFVPELTAFFAGHPAAWLELKTKSARVEELLAVKSVPRNVVVSWSVNAREVCRQMERGAASLEARLKAAAAVRDAGYRLGFHFDPLIRYPGWEEGYRETVERIYGFARPGDIAWISLGCLRYAPWMAPHIEARQAAAPFLAGELFPLPPDGKYRYPQPLRIEMHRALHGWIRQFDPEVFVYLCLESEIVWRWALGVELDPEDDLAIERLFPAPPGMAKRL